MFIARANEFRRRGFTLIEITIAVLILAGMSLAIYRFVQSNIVALHVSSEVNASEARFNALRDLLTTSLQSLPNGAGALTGEAVKTNDTSKDEMTWNCGAGVGLLTRYAPGNFYVSLILRPADKKHEHLDLGLMRKPADDDSTEGESWIPLIENVRSLEIHYFDPRLNVWQDRWTDNVTLPRLVRVTLSREGSTVPWDAVIPLGRTPL